MILANRVDPRSALCLVDISYHYNIDGEGTQDCDIPSPMA